MQKLHAAFRSACDDAMYPSLLLCSAYILDFTIIHPFRDGNGLISRLMTLWLLYIVGYNVGRHISLEKIIDDSKETYYEALGESTVAPELPYIPVLQGWTLQDYLRCIELYQAAGVNLTEAPIVGVGSVCRRQSTAEIGQIMLMLQQAESAPTASESRRPASRATAGCSNQPTRWPGATTRGTPHRCPDAPTNAAPTACATRSGGAANSSPVRTGSNSTSGSLRKNRPTARLVVARLTPTRRARSPGSTCRRA
jgi:hypothetical protein